MNKINIACIIDDDPIFIFGTKKIMQIANFCNSVHVFNNGAEAFSALKGFIENNEELPEIILLDLNMPIMDGWQFLDKITTISIPSSISIYIVTSSINPIDVEKSKQYTNVTRYIVKPISAADLKLILEDRAC
ncbi:response regulator [Neptunitalea chrysea]|uniref:Response regulator n=1 Tax=Neptunitalea chrysea TaxID=1647581 RepID=A0A9W6B3Z8_9FLAO|nr:response regulator [Neptunitalea chrysea]GLB51150.1 response regulator [Neptunitalea chrysea]